MTTRTLTPWERAMRDSIDGVPMLQVLQEYREAVLEQYHEAVTAPLVAALVQIHACIEDFQAWKRTHRTARLSPQVLASWQECARAAIESAKAGA